MKLTLVFPIIVIVGVAIISGLVAVVTRYLEPNIELKVISQ